MTDEEYVRSKWENVSVTDWYADTNCAVEAWSVQLYRWTSRVGHTAIDTEMWANAAMFTRERERQIAEVEEEIAYVDEYICGEPHGVECFNCRVGHRILAREQAALDELRIGMGANDDQS